MAVRMMTEEEKVACNVVRLKAEYEEAGCLCREVEDGKEVSLWIADEYRV